VRLDVGGVTRPFARALQQAYARVIRGGAPRVPHEGARGPVGGSLAQEVTRHDLVQHTRWGFTFTPSKLGLRFLLWWRGSRHQRARGREVPIDEQRLARDLERELARQVEAEDRRPGP
jgi:hypothetical protein